MHGKGIFRIQTLKIHTGIEPCWFYATFDQFNLETKKTEEFTFLVRDLVIPPEHGAYLSVDCEMGIDPLCTPKLPHGITLEDIEATPEEFKSACAEIIAMRNQEELMAKEKEKTTATVVTGVLDEAEQPKPKEKQKGQKKSK